MTTKMLLRCGIADLTTCCLMALNVAGCGIAAESFTPTPVKAPLTIQEARALLTSGSPEQRIAAALAVPTFGDDAREAVPQLEANLFFLSSHDVRRAAAIALGEIGQRATDAAPSLLDVLAEDPSAPVRVATADALGRIGSRVAVPRLAEHLGDESMEVQIACALAISRITDVQFQDVGSDGIYTLDESGQPLIVVQARLWWHTLGQYTEWE